MKASRPPYSVYDGRSKVRDFDLLRQAIEAANNGAGSTVRHQGVVVWRASDAPGFDRAGYQRELMRRRRESGYVEPARRLKPESAEWHIDRAEASRKLANEYREKAELWEQAAIEHERRAKKLTEERPG